MTLVLASSSPFRAAILRNAGLAIETEAATVDERAIERPLLEAGLDAADVAQVLAEAKASDVSSRRPGALVIGADQTMTLDGELLHKPADMEQARYRLLAMSGKTHTLHSGLALVRDGETVWRHVAAAHLHVRDLGPALIGRYLASVGDRALQSVGAYQIEGEGIQLFDRIEGDHFTIIGLPLLPLLAELRARGEIDG
ncbi:Maf-like protein [Roseitalea porphyridii]|uniref:7-methyl-GTP pyrophosphatase n=1 Tax=Roseitalea porphyridii TaxID=1852022 RepID=A0A4P6UY83_9HYPH|nr:Maf-like protein [Roseitalea porphyridii]QBK29264.1 Maf-like protein [Roseitalea porphyridii]